MTHHCELEAWKPLRKKVQEPQEDSTSSHLYLHNSEEFLHTLKSSSYSSSREFILISLSLSDKLHKEHFHSFSISCLPSQVLLTSLTPPPPKTCQFSLPLLLNLPQLGETLWGWMPLCTNKTQQACQPRLEQSRPLSINNQETTTPPTKVCKEAGWGGGWGGTE